MDWLAVTILDAIEQEGHMSASWLADKRTELNDASRLQVLRWVCHSLDTRNFACAARALDVTNGDLQATGRVLQKI